MEGDKWRVTGGGRGVDNEWVCEIQCMNIIVHVMCVHTFHLSLHSGSIPSISFPSLLPS